MLHRLPEVQVLKTKKAAGTFSLGDWMMMTMNDGERDLSGCFYNKRKPGGVGIPSQIQAENLRCSANRELERRAEERTSVAEIKRIF